MAMVIAALLTAAIGIWATSGYHGLPCGSMLANGPAVGQACPAPPAGPGGEMVTDSFYFVRQQLPGNGTMTARVTALAGSATPASKAGHPRSSRGPRPGSSSRRTSAGLGVRGDHDHR